ncbi:MAG: hypothetical protein FJ387_13575 [Verrucomicrobia bacterium]|nr:hypothetical protein [Verrucomicrobiota bacterium]
MRIPWNIPRLWGGLLVGVGTALAAIQVPLEFRQEKVTYNLQSQRGVPISSTVGTPRGSDGRVPTGINESGSYNLPTPNQFQGLISFGGIPGLVKADWLAVSNSPALRAGVTPFDGVVAEQMRLPIGRSNGAVALVVRRAQIGTPYLSRQVSFAFGALVGVPNTDEYGRLLTNIVKETYWLPEPYSTNQHTDTGYYWSPHAGRVFAVQAGPVFVTWRKAQTYTEGTKPSTYENPGGPPNFETNVGTVYLLYTMRYVVSGGAVQSPRKIYWTQRGFQTLGKPVAVPSARVADINIVYNRSFPRNVSKEYSDPSDSRPGEGTGQQPLEERRTLWYDKSQKQVLAYNQEGRVFIELLGNPQGSSETSPHLGFEIVDVFKQPTPTDVTIELGERLTPPPPGDLIALDPEPIDQGGASFAYQHRIEGSPRPEYYATRETVNLNDYLVHWLEEGVQGLKWPALLGRYRLVWPDDVAKYSHYLRPAAATDAEARQTAVTLAIANVPTIEYQDPLDRPRARLTETYQFYTWLDANHPAHRTLLRFVSGSDLAFERVFSWLDQSLQHANLTLTAFSTDFATAPSGATLRGHATVQGGFLRLTEAVREQSGDFVIDDFNGGQPVSNFRAVFNVSLRGGTTYAADGFSFNFGSIPNPGPREDGIGNGLSVCFDSYDNSADDVAPTIAIKFNGSIVAAVSMAGRNPNPEPAYVKPTPTDPATSQPMTLSTGERFVPVQIDLRSDGQMDVFYKNVKVLADVPTGYTPRTGQFALGARTGGSYTTHWIDDLTVVLNRNETAGQPTLADSVAARLKSWVGNTTFLWPDETIRPRVVRATAEVGRRIGAPAGELGATGPYVAGYIHQSSGRSFHPGAYHDPLASGFALANTGAIIPVNAIPGDNVLEVWWFRANSSLSGLNAGNAAKGFQTALWPSVIGHYTLEWPALGREIVLASKLGSGTLDPLEALGTIYHQNDPHQPGYNPNEEHAIMSGGTAFATRDDLNLTAGPNYSSHPFVLLSYTAADGRPAMSAFRVLREKPEAGYVFDYITPAGQMLQPPMPLPLLAKPIEGSGDLAKNYNTEPSHSGGDLPGSWDDVSFNVRWIYDHYQSFTWRDRHHDFWVYRGLHAGLPALEVGRYDPEEAAFVALPPARAVVGEPFRYTLHVSRQDEYLSLTSPNLPPWLRIDGLALDGTPASSDVASHELELVVEDLYDHTRRTTTLALEVLASGTAQTQAGLALPSINPYTQTVVIFTNRPPFLAHSPAPSNSFTMRYYYKTEPSFHWPGISNPPTPGTIVPYLRPVAPQTGQFLGDPDSKDTASLEIVYRPVWPVRDPKDGSKPLPTLFFGATLALPKAGLPGVRDMLTAHLLYQQSVAADIGAARPSVVLHDPTREKYADLASHNLKQLPGGIHADYYQGRYYFPNLPPHLASRVAYDPNRGSKGSLALKGEFVREVLGESYVLLNVLRGSDLAAVKALCPAGDPDKSAWDTLVGALATRLETFRESPTKPGTYEPDAILTETVGVEDLAQVKNANTAVDSYALSATGPGSGYVTLVESSGTAFTQPGDPVSMHVFKVGGELDAGEVKVIAAANPLSEQVTFQHTADLAGRFAEFEYEWKIATPVDGQPPLPDAEMTRYQALASATDLPRYTLGGAGIQALCDNYVVMRYRSQSADHPLYNQWSDWTAPKLGEGWIKRVLGGINPFNQRIADLFNHQVNTDVSMLTQAGRRWEGDVALNLENIDNFGLIEIYETVLRRGRMLSIESGYNYGPANDALLLAAGYLNDLYLLLGGEAWADAANPTIGIGTHGHAYSDMATALFAFRGQMASLLEEELALVRGRDDFLVPGVEVTPVYNRLIWNYTRGIDAGEVIYALNYNIQENPNQEPDGIINAEDAARLFPQGHGDAYGHYLTALKGYYSLLLNAYFDWVPRTEAVNVLGQPVSVDYQDERKFAAAAAALARAGRQVFDLTWRRDYQAVATAGWDHFATTRANRRRTYTQAGTDVHPVRHWCLDHWACRSGQGNYLNWIVGNAILPDVDPNPDHEGIQKIDRTTVPELPELAKLGEALQTALDNAEGGLSPLGMPEGGLAFDINPSAVVGTEGGTHFEQIYQRAKVALNNAVAAFDDAKGVTALLRAEQDSLTEFQAAVARQELAFRNALIELYGTPYPDDIGPGKQYPQGYAGPDLIHYMYVETPEYPFPELWSFTTGNTFRIDVQNLPDDWATYLYQSFQADDDTENSDKTEWLIPAINDDGKDLRTLGVHYVEFDIGSHGFLEKPAAWTGRRAAPGKLQQAISEYIMAHTRLRQALNDSAGAKNDLDKAVKHFQDFWDVTDEIYEYQKRILKAQEAVQWANFANDMWQVHQDTVKETIKGTAAAIEAALPLDTIVGVSSGGDLTSAARAAIKKAGLSVVNVIDWAAVARNVVVKGFENATETANRWIEWDEVGTREYNLGQREAMLALGNQLSTIQGHLWTINERLRQLEDASRKKQALLAEGDRIQEERLVLRQHAAAVIQGYRTRDAAFRLFRNEKLERYKTLFDLAARYALLAANAYDYETGLLHTPAGRNVRNRIVSARALGIVRNGEPQYAGSNTGDPGLSSVLAEMKADWDVLRGRLGFNNPDSYGTTLSLRTELFRILPTADGDVPWKDVLQAARRRNLLEDEDVRRFAMQLDDGRGLPVPGLVLTFNTTIADGYNLFGQHLAAGDHAFSPSAFATKIFGVGVALIGYRGMDDPTAQTAAVGGAGGTSPSDPNLWFLDPLALSATPYVYLIPVGVDSMRSPPLGDASVVRTWRVDDLAIPMPFNIGASGFSTKPLWQSSDALTEPLFAVRKHQAFRPVSSTACFSPNLYTGFGTLQRSQFTNNRLVGRSVWNSQWKLVIPGKTLLRNPNQGIDRFIQTVTDVKLHLVTYSYAGN